MLTVAPKEARWHKKTVLLLVLVIGGPAIGVGYVISSESYLCRGCGVIMAVPNVTADFISCSNDNGTCTVRLMNSGSVETEVTGCIVTVAGTTTPCTFSPNPAVLQAPGSVVVSLDVPAGRGTGVGNSVVGSFQLVNGGMVEWTGVWT